MLLRCRLNTIPIKIPIFFWSFLAEIDKLILKFLWKCEGPRTTRTILKKKTKLKVPSLKNQDTVVLA